MSRLTLISNPSASGFTGAGYRDALSVLSQRYDVTPVWPADAAESRSMARLAADEGTDVVVAMGGDGVVHHVANGLVGSATMLGILPAGTTNVLARIHGLPLSPTRAARHLLDATPKVVSAAHFTTSDRVEGPTGHAMFSLGLGFDADVVAVAETRPHAKLYFGPLHYGRTALGRILGPYRGKPAHISVAHRDQRVDAVTTFIQVEDPYTYFGPAPLRLGSSPPGTLTVLSLERITPVTAADIMTRLATRRSLAGVAGATLWTGVDKLVVEADPEVSYQADGELLGRGPGLEVSAVAVALTLLA